MDRLGAEAVRLEFDDLYMVTVDLYDPMRFAPYKLKIDLRVFAHLRQLLKTTAGRDLAIQFIFTSLDIVQVSSKDETYDRVSATLDAVERFRFQDTDDFLLSRSYHLLRDKKLGRAAVATVASSMLNTPISTDSWRKRVDRWAEKEGLPKVELYNRRQDESDKE